MGVINTTQSFSDGDQVTSGKLNDITLASTFTNDAVFNATLKVTGGKLEAGVMQAANLGANSVTNSAIAAGAVQTSQIAVGAVILSRLGANSVDASKIINNNVFIYHFDSSVFALKAQVEGEAEALILTPERAKFALGTSKAHGGFPIGGTPRTLRPNSYNVSSITRIDSTHTQVNITRNMNSVNYVAWAQFESGGTENLSCTTYDRQVGSFKIMHPAEAANRSVSFGILGVYT